MLKHTQKLLLAASVAAFVLLLRKLDARAVFALVAGAGWWLAAILPQEGVCHFFNAAAWRLCFSGTQSRAFSLRALWRMRLVGDALNYLTPTASIGGEVARVGMLGEDMPCHQRMCSVLVAKLSQMLALAAFLAFGVVSVVTPRLPATARWTLLREAAAVALALGAAAYLVYALAGRRWIAAGSGEGVRPALRDYFRAHPARLGASTALFACAYAWSALEAWTICRAIRLPVTFGQVLAIETLSMGLDSLLPVPGKIGTAESGKTAIFALLGMPAASGFAFGVLRHVRELLWAFSGVTLGWLTAPGELPAPAPLEPPLAPETAD